MHVYLYLKLLDSNNLLFIQLFKFMFTVFVFDDFHLLKIKF